MTKYCVNVCNGQPDRISNIVWWLRQIRRIRAQHSSSAFISAWTVNQILYVWCHWVRRIPIEYLLSVYIGQPDGVLNIVWIML